MATIKFLDQAGLKTVLNKLAAGDLKMTGPLSWKQQVTSSATISTNNGYIDVGTGYINFSSDKRLKENIINICDLLDKVLSTEIKKFNFISNPDEPCIGVIAQDIKENFKDTPLANILVKEDQNGMLSVNETKFVYVLWEAFKEYVEESNNRVASLEHELGLLKDEIKKLTKE